MSTRETFREYSRPLQITHNSPNFRIRDVRVLSMSTGEPHPLAQHPTLEPLRDPVQEVDCMRICGDLAVLVYFDGDGGMDGLDHHMYVWDWKTGDLLVVRTSRSSPFSPSAIALIPALPTPSHRGTASYTTPEQLLHSSMNTLFSSPTLNSSRCTSSDLHMHPRNRRPCTCVC